ncbi:MAG: YncE family protein [Thermoplasmata archaeon]|nr:YncE family protein [Thermoplasmata archaeon]
MNASLVLFNGTVVAGLGRAVPNDAPSAIATDPSASRLYVADQNSNLVSVVNLTSGKVLGTLAFPSGGPLSSLAVDSRSNELYGIDPTKGYLDAVNLSGNHSTAAQIALSSPEELLYDPASGEVFVTSGSPNQLLVYNGTNHTLLSSFSTTGTPAGIALDGTGPFAYVAASSSNSVDRIDLLNGSVQSLPVGTDPTGVAVSTANHTLFVTNAGSDNVSLLNLTTLASRTVAVGTSPEAVLYDSATERVYVANSGGDNVSVFNSTSTARPASLAVGDFPDYLAVDLPRAELYVSASSRYNITGVNTTSGNVSREISVGNVPTLVSWNPGSSTLLVSDALSRWGYEVNGSSLSAHAVPIAGTHDLSSAVAPSIGKLFLASAVDNRIWSLFLSNGSVATSAALPYGPVSLAYDPGTERLFAADPTASSVAVFDAGTLTELGAIQFPTPALNVSLSGMAVDPSTEQLYVGEHAAGRVAVLNTTTLRFVTNLSIASPSALTFVFTSNRVAVASGTNLVFVNALNRATLASVRLGSPAGSVSLSPSTGDLYVASTSNDSIEIVQPNPAVARGNISLAAVAGTPGLDAASGTLWIPEPSLGVIAGAPLGGKNPLWIRNLSATVSSIPVDLSMNFTADVAGGVAPYRYLYIGLPSGCAPLNRSRLPCSPDLAGNYTVRLEVKDATGNSTNATVSLNVSALPTVLIQGFSAVPPRLDLGASTVLHVLASTNLGTINFAYTGLPPGCSSSNTPTLPCTPTTTGNFTPHVTVTGILGIQANTSLLLSVYPYPGIASFQSTLTHLDAGETTVLSVVPTGGDGPFALAYTGLPSGCVTSNSTSLSCRPSGAGNFTVQVTASDSAGGQANASLQMVVTPATVIGSFEASPGAADVGETVAFTAQAGGGAGFLAFSYAGLPPGCVGANLSAITCVPSQPGNFTVTLSVKDSLAPAVQRSLELPVAARPQVSSFAASPRFVETGGVVTLNVLTTGGTGLLVYSYVGLPASCGVPSTPSVVCQVTQAGTFTASVTVVDGAKVSTTASTSFEVLLPGTVHPTIQSFVATSTRITVGQATILTVQVSNTSAWFGYAYSGLPTGCGSLNESVLSCTPTGPGSFTVTVLVSSPYGGSARQALNLTILPSASLGGTSASRPSGPPLFSLVLAGALGLFAVLLAMLYRQQRRRTAREVRAAPPPPPFAALAEPAPSPPPLEEPAAVVEEPTPVATEPAEAANIDPLAELQLELDLLTKELSDREQQGESALDRQNENE